MKLPVIPDLHTQPTPQRPRWLTGSRAEQALDCPAVMVLDEVESKGEAAQHGTCVHFWAETGLIPPALSPRQQERLKGIDRLKLWPVGGDREIRLWYDPLTRTAGIANGRDDLDSYPLSAVSLVCDYVAGLRGGLAWVDDLKTGYWVSPSAVCPQLLTGALCLYKIREQAGDPVDSVLLSITKIKRYPIASEPERLRDRVYADQILGWERRIWELYGTYMLERTRLATGALPDARVGEWCRFCKCKPNCPAWRTKPNS